MDRVQELRINWSTLTYFWGEAGVKKTERQGAVCKQVSGWKSATLGVV